MLVKLHYPLKYCIVLLVTLIAVMIDVHNQKASVVLLDSVFVDVEIARTDEPK